ncbi:MbtH family protein [Serratia rhizosphaerae]|uniref:MbtH family protein n=1 Tax=Serratia rhizosphaerae TaxID=2597702 RepID=UPI002DC0391E|nr:MbtH family protein [Serratia rhizosphaerae]MEB6336927.1 MbtH family protein [Serratia rhizosphaerae]
MDMPNPFDDPQQRCLILCNGQQQYSLWPDFSPAPAGWRTVFGPAVRAECVGWLETHWRDMRPAAQREQQ